MQLAGVFSKKTAGKSAAKPPEMGEIIKFSDKESFDYSTIIIVFAVVISVVVTFMFWWTNRNLASAVISKQDEKDTIIQEITSPTYSQVEKRAADFKDAVTMLKDAASKRYAVNEFLPEFFKYITNDVQVSNLSFNSDNNITITGSTKSYRSIAELMMALQSWQVLSGVKLQSFGVADDADETNPKASFVISASVDTTKGLAAETGSSAAEEIIEDTAGSTVIDSSSILDDSSQSVDTDSLSSDSVSNF
ncbi:MAG: PilN domain-containing protein [Patescibacteria group bacterium]|jgi:Tfp pilus assembly protein PilN